MTEHEQAVEPAMATSPYLSLRQAVRPAILAHCLLAADQERAGKLAAECEDLLFLTRELLKAAGRARILDDEPGLPETALPETGLPESGEGGDRAAQFLDAYADAGLLWASGRQCAGSGRGADRPGRVGGRAPAGQLPRRRRRRQRRG